MSTHTVDVIIVGGGSAGAVLAARLSATAPPRHDVSAGQRRLRPMH